jgi:small GTP-binding protein
MNDIKPDFDEFVEQFRGELTKSWEALPKETRQKLTKALGLLPGDVQSWRSLIDEAIDHLRVAAGSKRNIAIVGPVNVGKSTLYNQFVRTRSEKAAVSAIPGTTRYVHQADAGLFTVIDTPGADAPGVVGEVEKERALSAANDADVLVVLFDATHGIRDPEQSLFAELLNLGKPTIVALNKIDMIKKELPQVIGRAAGSLRLPSEQLVPISAKKGTGIEKLLVAIAKSEPGIVAALGAALPEYRWKLVQTSISRAASTAAAIAITPLPFLDFFPLLGVQAAMVLSIARIHAYKITARRARELIATFGIAVLGRTLFYELSKLGGPPGWLLAAGVAVGTTTALGYAASVWFERGEKLSKDSIAKISRDVTETVVDRLKAFGRRKPKKVTLRERIEKSLEDIPPLEEMEEDEAWMD